MNTKEVAVLTGVSVRTLHHYDKIGLLAPSRRPDNDYREYTEKDLDRLQQILFFKACGFPLVKIKKLLDSPTFDRTEVFLLQKKYLLQQKAQIEAMLKTLDKTIKTAKGEATMTPREKFGCFDMSHNPYEEEARRLWGDEAVNQSKTHIEAMSGDEQIAVAKGMDELFKELAEVRTEAPDSNVAQKAMDKMYHYFNQNFGYQYTPAAFAGVGQLYVGDGRFTKNIDKYGQGLARFLCDAMRIYAAGQA